MNITTSTIFRFVTANGGPARARRGWLGTLGLSLVALLLWLGSATPGFAQQQGAVAGTVVSAETLEPLSGVQVSVVGTDRGTLSGPDGSFRIAGLTGPTVRLRLRLIGYQRRTVSVELGNLSAQLRLEESAVELDQIVVTGQAGETRAREIGNSITSIDAGEMVQQRQPLDLQTVLPAEVPGLRIRSSGGEIGTGGTISIRGAGSLSLDNQPLIYVDGVRVNAESNATSSAFRERSRSSRMNDLNMDDVERIEVIKGPAAATLYGTEASNGVVQIITNRGSTTEPRINLAFRAGLATLLNAADKYPLNYATDPVSGELVTQNLVKSERERGTPIFRDGFPRGAYGSISGQLESVQYYLSAKLGREEGMVSYQWQESLNNRANIAYIGSEDFEVRGNLGVVRQRTHSSGLEQPITMDIMWGSPLKRDGPTRGFFLEVPEDFECCVDGLEKVDRTTGSIHVRYNPFEWFEQRLIVGADISNVKSQTTWPRTAVQPGPFEEDNLGRKEITNHRTELITVDYAATLPLNLTNSLALETSFGAQYNKDDNEIVEASGIEFPVAGVSTIAAAATRTSGEQAIENKTFGAFVQARIGWKDRRFVTGAVRGDDNSAFGKEFDFEEYPKVNFSWLLSEEPFFDLGFVESLKVRGAWGQAGQQPDVFAARRLFEPATGPGGVPTVTPQNIGNPNLKPEVGDEWEVGFESGLLDGRLSLDVTYYRQLRKDAIVQQAALPSRGFPGFQLVNLGEVENSGVELSSQADIVANEDLNWSVGVGFSTTDNEVKEVGDIPPPQLRGTGGAVFTQQRHIEGFPVGSLFLTKVVSAEFDGQGNLVNVMCEGGDPITGGGAPVPCDEAGTAFMGQPVPTWDLSVHTSVDYRNFSLRGLAGGHGGNVKCNGDIAWAHVFFRNTKAINEMSDPILAAYDRMGAVCQAGLVDNGFIKLRSLSGTYRFPDRMAGLLGADNASVNVSVENPAILWMAESHKFGRKVIDPEVTSSNINGMNAYQQDQWPQLQRFIAEVRLTF